MVRLKLKAVIAITQTFLLVKSEVGLKMERVILIIPFHLGQVALLNIVRSSPDNLCLYIHIFVLETTVLRFYFGQVRFMPLIILLLPFLMQRFIGNWSLWFHLFIVLFLFQI